MTNSERITDLIKELEKECAEVNSIVKREQTLFKLLDEVVLLSEKEGVYVNSLELIRDSIFTTNKTANELVLQSKSLLEKLEKSEKDLLLSQEKIEKLLLEKEGKFVSYFETIKDSSFKTNMTTNELVLQSKVLLEKLERSKKELLLNYEKMEKLLLESKNLLEKLEESNKELLLNQGKIEVVILEKIQEVIDNENTISSELSSLKKEFGKNFKIQRNILLVILICSVISICINWFK